MLGVRERSEAKHHRKRRQEINGDSADLDVRLQENVGARASDWTLYSSHTRTFFLLCACSTFDIEGAMSIKHGSQLDALLHWSGAVQEKHS